MALLTLAQIGLGVAVSWRNRGKENYFAGGRSLRWYTIAGSIFGTNISALHLVGMLGIGYSVGFAQSHFELLAVFAIIALAFVFVPLYRKVKIFTLSEFLEIRFGPSVRLTYSIMMLALILVQMVASFYIGARALALLTQGSPFPISYPMGVAIQAIVICSYTMFGGLKAVMITESFQTIFIIIAATLLFVLTFAQPEIGGFFNLWHLDGQLPAEMQKMHLYLPSNHPDLPWTGVFTGLMLLHLFYWNTNQFIVQRVIAAESDRQAKLGVLGVGLLKLLIPFLTISTGVAAAHLFRIRFGGEQVLPDDAFVYLVDTVVPRNFGLVGLVLAGVAAAVFSTIDAMMNAATTLFTMDIFKKYLRPDATDHQMVLTGRITVLMMAVSASLLALWTYDPSGAGNFFLTVASRGSYFTPGIIVAFFGAVLYRRSTTRGALWAILSAPFFAYAIEYTYDHELANIPSVAAIFGSKLNFLHRVLLTFLCSLGVFLSLLGKEEKATDKVLVMLPKAQLRTLLIKCAQIVTVNGLTTIGVLFLSLDYTIAGALAGFGTFIICVFDGGRFVSAIPRIIAAVLAGITVAILFLFW